MKSIIMCLVSVVLFSSQFEGQLVEVFSEEVFSTDIAIGDFPAGFSTYRIYARLQDPTDRISAVFGSTAPQPMHHLTLGSTENVVYNSGFAGTLGTDNNCAFWNIFPQMQWDSYVTFQATNASNDPCPQCAPAGTIFQISNPAGEIPATFASAPYGPTLQMEDGSWFVANDGSCYGFPTGLDNRILIAQISVPTGTLTYCLNISVYDEAVGANQLIYVHGEQDPPGFVGSIPEIDGSALGLCGGDPGSDCTDPLACNYNPNATEDDGSCLYDTECFGCTDYYAENFNPFVPFDDGSCTYTISGFVYRDTNEDGSYNNADYPAENIPVILMPENITVNTDAGGNYEISGVTDAPHTISVDIAGTEYTGTSTPASIDFEPGIYDLEFNFGLTNDIPFYDVSVTSAPYWWWEYFTWCHLAHTRHFYVQNDGNTTIDPVLTIAFNELLSFGYSNPDYTSLTENEIVFELDPLVPGTSAWVSVVWDPPGVDLAGTNLLFETTLDVYDSGNYVESHQLSNSSYVWCSYDPNAKLAYPVGYTEEHFISNETELDYIITFQNTGSATAENVTLLDTLDTSLDLSTFQLIEHSHDVQVSIDEETREVFFVFANINLPDSTSNEEASHGHAIFRIGLNSGLAPGTVVENTAHIYFDSNPPITTNTVWHTIFDCDGLAQFTVNDTVVCATDTFTVISNQPLIEDYVWTVNNESQSGDQFMDFSFSDPGLYMITLEASNPACDETFSIPIEVYPWVQSSFDYELFEDGWLLTANDGIGWQWYLEGEPIEGATSQLLQTDQIGNYSVMSFTDSGCNLISEEIFVWSGTGESESSIWLYPNPATNEIHFGKVMSRVELRDALGRKLLSCNNCSSMNCQPLVRGCYFISAGEHNATLILE